VSSTLILITTSYCGGENGHTSHPAFPWRTRHWTLDISVIILLLIIVFVTILKICHCCANRRYEFQLYAHIGYQTRSVQIHVKTFKLHPDHYKFRASKYVDSFHVSGYILPHLIIIWPTLRISSVMTNENHQLPTSVPLTWTQANFLHKALRKSYWCLFVTKVGDKQSILSLPIRLMTIWLFL